MVTEPLGWCNYQPVSYSTGLPCCGATFTTISPIRPWYLRIKDDRHKSLTLPAVSPDISRIL
jgi:hypothetical protein